MFAACRFYDIAWGPPDVEHPGGIIAGALENGSLDLWDADKLLSGASDAFMSRTTKHTGSIRSLQFNPLKPHILATAGAKGELFVYDVNDISNPFRLGTAAARADDLECVAWNRKVPHILATGGTGGFVTVWDLKTKKASLTLNNNRKAVSAIAWDPNNSTKLLTATPDDMTPVILLWDLRNSNAPERTLQGHEQGVLSLSWCDQDSDLLISCGKDNRTLLWNPQTGERYGEFPEVTNWTFSTRFDPHNPNLSATASFDGKITIQTLQNTNPSVSQASAQTNLDGEDFFAKAQSQPQGASFSLSKAPKWFERPIGASFGYGGKLVVFSRNQTAAGQKASSKVEITSFHIDSDVGAATENFEKAISDGDIAAICDSHLENAKTDEEKAEWRIMKTLAGDSARSQVVSYLGFSKDSKAPNGDAEASKADAGSNGAKNARAADDSNFFGEEGEGDDFLSDLAASKSSKTDKPFHLLSEGNTALEDQVTKAIIVGDFEKAAHICLAEDRVADAIIIANCGGKELLEKVQAKYLSTKAGGPSYLRLLNSVVGNNLWDVVYNADLANWKESMVTLCTFADPSEFPDLCEALGDRILDGGDRRDASFCYLVGSKLEKVVKIWIAELQESETAGLKDEEQNSTFSVHARSLQDFIEKVTVFRHITKFADPEKSVLSGWKLAPLYDKYIEYADIVAAHGHLATAEKYLDLLPVQYPAAEVARGRVKLATQKRPAAQVQAPVRQGGSNARAASRAQPAAYQGYQTTTPARGQSPLNPYGPPASSAAPSGLANPYSQPSLAPYGTAAASASAASNAYAPPSQSYTPSQPSGYPAPGGYGQSTPYGAPPPRNATPSTLPPPPKAKDVGQWNDVPMVTKPPPARRTTPGVAPITSPFPGQPAHGPGLGGLTSPPPMGPYQSQSGNATPAGPPPPPKGAAPPRVTSPPTGPPPAGRQIARPPSAAANAYAPSPTASAAPGPAFPGPTPQLLQQRTASPYNAPPAGGPPSNRYAPAPAAAQPAPPSGPSGPPQGGQYAPPQAHQGGQQGPPPQGGRPPIGPPPTGPPPASHAKPVGAPPRAAPPAKSRHPAGDRSHIPQNAQRLVDILSRDMQRVSAKAPSSFMPQVKDTEKRLNLLFDHLNNEELIKPDTIADLTQLAEALEAKNYEAAQRLQVDIQREKTDENGNWMVCPLTIYFSNSLLHRLMRII
jgi:protein transport protein SEC31